MSTENKNLQPLLCIEKSEKSSNCPEIFKMPKSSVLERVQQFMPTLKSANKELESQLTTRDPRHFDIENIENNEGPVIEMNIGIFEQDSDENISYSEESDSDCSCDELNCSCTKTAVFATVNNDNIKIPGKKTKEYQLTENKKSPGIEILHETDKQEKPSPERLKKQD